MDTQDIRELETVYAKVRGGVDPDTRQLHMTESEFKEAVQAIIDSHVKRAEIQRTKDIKYAIMRGEYGHDEINIVKSLEDRINTLTKELKGE